MRTFHSTLFLQLIGVFCWLGFGHQFIVDESINRENLGNPFRVLVTWDGLRALVLITIFALALGWAGRRRPAMSIRFRVRFSVIVLAWVSSFALWGIFGIWYLQADYSFQTDGIQIFLLAVAALSPLFVSVVLGLGKFLAQRR